MLTFGSLFSGIGGIDLGLERAGMTCVWQSEIEPYACRVLAKHWPAIPNLGDIRDIDWTTVPRTDVVAGGYPCQPFSLAGRRAGADDPRHLWPMFADCIRMVRPRYALLENVSGHLTLGFGDVQADLAALGYDTRWDCIPAAAVGAPHLRDRVFIIARDSRPEQRRSVADRDNSGSYDPLRAGWDAPWHGSTPLADTSCSRCQTFDPTQGTGELAGHACRCNQVARSVADSGCVTAQIPITRRQSTVAQSEWRAWWQVEPGVGRVVDGLPNRMDRLRGLGNAVVPQVAEHVGRIIMSMEET